MKKVKHPEMSQAVQTKAQKQASVGTILQVYKDKTAQGQATAEEAPLQRQPNHTGLPDHLKNGIENLSGYSMDDVKVHYDSSQPATLQAHAYAQGTDIHIAPGQEKHLPHEAWHVVQQKQGRVKPTMQMKGVNVNDNAVLEQEADVMGAKALGTTTTQTKLKNGIAIKTSIQRKGEAGALESITDSKDTEMRRGNNRNSISDTSGKSMAWIAYLRSDKLSTDLKAKVKEVYLATSNLESRFEAWYTNRKKMIHGLVYKHVQFGNCGEFSSALYGELQQSTKDQYVYKASWMWEVDEADQTAYMKKFKRTYPDRIIKDKSADHAFVVTYPTLVAGETFRYVPVQDLEGKAEGDDLPMRYYSPTRYKMSNMKKDQAMVADGWLDRKVQTLAQAKIGDWNTILTEPTKAGEHTVDSGMHAEIVAWAKAFKTTVETDMGFKSKAYDRRNYAGGYGDASHKGLVSKDERPNYIKALHGDLTVQTECFTDAWNTKKAELIAYFKDSSDGLITELGEQILFEDDKSVLKNFIQCLKDSNKTAVFDTMVLKIVTSFKTQVEVLETLVGKETFMSTRADALALLETLPVESRGDDSPFHAWYTKITAAKILHDKFIRYKVIKEELEGLVGQEGFEAKDLERRNLFNTEIPAEKRSNPILAGWRAEAKAIKAIHQKFGEFNTLVQEMEALIKKSGFGEKESLAIALYHGLPAASKAPFKALKSRAIAASKANLR